MVLGETVQIDIPGWLIVLILAIAFLLVVLTVAGVVFGFVWAARAGGGSRRHLWLWIGVGVLELWAFVGAAGDTTNAAFWMPSAALIGQIATFAVARSRR